MHRHVVHGAHCCHALLDIARGSKFPRIMPTRILVLSAAVGAGHLRAAQAVELALREIDPAAEVRNLDVLGLTNAAFRQVYAEAYLDLVNLAPHVLGFFYDMRTSCRHKSSRACASGERSRRRRSRPPPISKRTASG